MGGFYQKIIRPILFLQDPERAHDTVIVLMKALSKSPTLCRFLEFSYRQTSGQPIKLFGLTFPNAVGLAAGMDKNGQVWRVLSALGFGHVEIGTVTAQRQPGNPRPRLFRYPNQEALINRMGFNNDGAKAIAKRLKSTRLGRRRPHIPLGINIGKSKATTLEMAADDYLTSFNLLAAFADYFAVNVSSPNTPKLRQLQGHRYLPDLLNALREANLNRAHKLGQKPIPLLVKISPDLTFRQIDSILADVIELGYNGIIATNSTVTRPGVMANCEEAGGLSGRPLHKRALEIIKYIHHATNGKLPIIGVGGIHDAVSAGQTVDAGASLVQIYTGLIFKGPSLPREVARALAPRTKDWV